MFRLLALKIKYYFKDVIQIQSAFFTLPHSWLPDWRLQGKCFSGDNSGYGIRMNVRIKVFNFLQIISNEKARTAGTVLYKVQTFHKTVWSARVITNTSLF